MQANAPVELTSVSTSVGHSCSWIGADDADYENNDEDRVQGVFLVFMVFKSLFFGFQGPSWFSWYFKVLFRFFQVISHAFKQIRNKTLP